MLTQKHLDGIEIISTDSKNEYEQFVVFVCGGGKTIGANRFKEWQEKLYEKNIGSLSFNFQGVENSDGNIEEDSLVNRKEVLEKVIEYIKDNFNFKELSIYAVSMGGYVALDYLQTNSVNGKVILHAPAAYAKEANDKKFGYGFSEILRTPDSWLNSESFLWLQNIPNETLLLIPKNDEVIPKGISERYIEIIENKHNSKYYNIQDSLHSIWSDSVGDIKLREEIIIEVLDFIN